MTPFHRALIGILPAWRSLVRRELPMWGVIRRRRLTPARDAALRAEFRCALCDWQEDCRQLLAGGRAKPGYRCPNARLLRRQP